MMDPDDMIDDDIPCMGDEPQVEAWEGPKDDGCGDEPPDQFLTDGEADADALASAGMGTDEDYGCYGGGDE